MSLAQGLMGFLAPEDRERIRSRVSLEEIVREYDVHLIPAGRKLKGLCPFHQEKTPSFWVDVDKQFYYCFGCEAGGDLFRFVQEMERISFPEAAEVLARRAGVVLETRDTRRGGSERVQRLYDALAFARDFYHRLLVRDPRGEAAREYLRGRGIGQEMWEAFQLGVSPDGWDGFVRDAVRSGHAPEALERAGLARARPGGAGRGSGSGHYDYFRSRLMFPITDVQGRVIGFGGRTLGTDEPKYLNTPKTALFDKSHVLYGLAQAKRGIRREEAIAVVEGYTDVVMAHQEGLDFFVASLGTAFTRENAVSLRRQAPRVYMVFDGDAAGLSASERSIDLLVDEDLDVRIYTVRAGKDPCDALLAMGGDAFRRSLEEETVDLFEFKWRRTMGAAGSDPSPQVRARAVDEFLRLVARVKNKVTRRLVLRDFMERLGLKEKDVEEKLAAFERQGPSTALRPASGGSARGSPPAGTGPAGVRAAASDGGGVLEPLAELVVECLLALPERAEEIWNEVPPALLGGRCGQAFACAVQAQLDAGFFSGARLLQDIEDAEAQRIAVKLLSRIERQRDDANLVTDYCVLWQNCRRDLNRWRIRSRLEGLREEMLETRANDDPERLASLRREVSRLRKELKKR